jgi:hypothetical protein
MQGRETVAAFSRLIELAMVSVPETLVVYVAW